MVHTSMGTAVPLPSALLSRLMDEADQIGLPLNQYCQLLLENQLQSNSKPTHAPGDEHNPITNLKLSGLDPARLNPLADEHPFSQGAISGHINRLLPLKIGCRILWSMCKPDGTGPTPGEFRSMVAAQSQSLRTFLKGMDENQGRPRGDRLHSSFPTKGDAAINRFLNQYIIKRTGSNPKQTSGALSDFGLIGITKSGNIQLTESGRKFALLPNPIIDEDNNQQTSLSADEQVLLLSQIRGSMDREWKFMRHILDGIHVGSNTPTSLLSRIMRRYGPGTKANWSESVMPHMRSGVLGRMQALGLIKRTYTENRVEYRVTPLALVILEGDAA